MFAIADWGFLRLMARANLPRAAPGRTVNSPLTAQSLQLPMYESKRERFLRLSSDAQAAMVAAARDGTPVRGLKSATMAAWLVVML